MAIEGPIDDARLAPDDFPLAEEVAVITTFREATEALRSPKLRPGLGTRSTRMWTDADGSIELGAPGPDTRPHDITWDEFFRRGDLSHRHGVDHLELRRTLNPLFGRDAHLWFRDTVLVPALERNLKALKHGAEPDQVVRADLVVFAKRLFVQVAAALVGFDRVDTEEAADALVALHSGLEYGRRRAEMLAPGPEREREKTRALKARTELIERFYEKSLQRRRDLVARHSRGEIDRSALPHDLLTLVAEGAPMLRDPQVGLALSMSFVNGAMGTNTLILLHATASLAEWFESHPGDRDLRLDAAFLEGAVHETLRLHSTTNALSRIATEDLTLSTGRMIKAGQYVAIMRTAISRDESVFGPDADRFDPRRHVPAGTYQFGLGFGAGAHMCMGLPLVLGQGGITGMQVPTLQGLYRAGVSLDPDRPPRKRAEILPFRNEFESFPVIFGARR